LNKTNSETARLHSTPASNQGVLPTAASFGWTVEAAAADPRRSAGGISANVRFPISIEARLAH